MEETNTIKGIEVIAYKGMNSDMTCRDFKYEIGKTYKTDKAKLYECGFHACLNPQDVLDYYPRYKSSRYFKVLLSGEIAKCDFYNTEVAATEITILEEINIKELLNITEWWKNKNVIDLLYFSEGLARLKNCESKYNFIDKKGKILSEQWFEWVDDFKDGFARLHRSDKLYNFINKQGKLLSDEWFYWVDIFNNGLAVVQRRNDLRNFIGKKGKILSDEWFNDAHSFIDGLAIVQRTNGECCKIDKTGKLIKNLQ